MYGGFYINMGSLEFKKAEGTESVDYRLAIYHCCVLLFECNDFNFSLFFFIEIFLLNENRRYTYNMLYRTVGILITCYIGLLVYL